MKKILLVLAIVLLLPIVALVSFHYYQAADRPFQGDVSAEVNKVRTNHNLPPLTQTDSLNNIAKAKCDDMIRRAYYGHQDPEGKYTWDLFKYDYKWSGENLARGYKIFTAKDHVDGWVNSPEHYRNLVDPNYTEVGYAICDGGSEYTIVQILRG